MYFLILLPRGGLKFPTDTHNVLGVSLIIDKTSELMKCSPSSLFELWWGIEDGDTEGGGVVVVRELTNRKTVPVEK